MVQHHSARPTRREFLGHACRCGAGFAAITLMPACAGDAEPPGPQVDLSQLPDGSRMILIEGLLGTQTDLAFTLTMLGTAALVALLLGAVGIY